MTKQNKTWQERFEKICEAKWYYGKPVGWIMDKEEMELVKSFISKELTTLCKKMIEAGNFEKRTLDLCKSLNFEKGMIGEKFITLTFEETRQAQMDLLEKLGIKKLKWQPNKINRGRKDSENNL